MKKILQNLIIFIIPIIPFLGLLYFYFFNPSFNTPNTFDEEIPPQVLILEPSLIYAKEISKEEVLKDRYDRISPEFTISKPLLDRVSFWFDIYTKYDSKHQIIHHNKYPWIIYDVVDTHPIFQTTKHHWTKHHESVRFIEKRRKQVYQTLKNLVHKSSYKNLTPEEQNIFDLLKKIPGSRKSVLREALYTIRSQTGQKDFFINGLNGGAPYFPLMEKVFEKYNLPTELTRIPLVESSFNKMAESRVGAVGIWQIMPNIARGEMVVSQNIDERRSPLKATMLAAKILKTGYRAFNNWPLAVSSYNNGIGNLKTSLRRHKSNSLESLVNDHRQGSFQFASSNFYTCFLAALYAEKYQQEIFGHKHEALPPLLAIARMKKSTLINDIINMTQLPQDQFYKFNPDFQKTHNFKVPAGFRLVLPIYSEFVLLDSFQNIIDIDYKLSGALKEFDGTLLVSREGA